MLIIDGNSVYEIDCECARKRGMFGERIKEDREPEEGIHSDTGGRRVERSVYTGRGVTVAVLDTGVCVMPV